MIGKNERPRISSWSPNLCHAGEYTTKSRRILYGVMGNFSITEKWTAKWQSSESYKPAIPHPSEFKCVWTAYESHASDVRQSCTMRLSRFDVFWRRYRSRKAHWRMPTQKVPRNPKWHPIPNTWSHVMAIRPGFTAIISINSRLLPTFIYTPLLTVSFMYLYSLFFLYHTQTIPLVVFQGEYTVYTLLRHRASLLKISNGNMGRMICYCTGRLTNDKKSSS